ncbi:nucleotidyl transferase AbiEii/AbiGii toxin family protein [Microlunatus speluncae]|uniref:nucleotidyl transferase AbiEii/AbiGii toxin family protein n=1 Tax=Microlunatus speluncae TaxID=2594267 RepID=UPI001266799D|nr:nucleotidyl transferase AbiEii/AbiGii toxin family protein [Microlunatus speluncae]
MTVRLRDDPDALNVLVARAADYYGISAAYIEKDFWVTEVLRVASRTRPVRLPDGHSADTTFIFKGGTSLSRVFGLTQRFSEDIDLIAVFNDEAAPGARHKILKLVDAEVSAHVGTAGDVVPGSSTTGIKRYTNYRYPVETAGSGLKEGVLLELGSRGGTFPVVVHSYRSMLTDFVLAEIPEDEHVWEEFAPFDVTTLSPERTLLEKIAAVHDAAARSDTGALAKFGRHFYDIHCLLANVGVRQALVALGDAGLSALVEDINSHSAQAGFPWTPRPDGGYAESPAFDRDHESRAAIAVGVQAAQELVYGVRPTLEDITEIVAEHRDLL